MITDVWYNSEEGITKSIELIENFSIESTTDVDFEITSKTVFTISQKIIHNGLVYTIHVFIINSKSYYIGSLVFEDTFEVVKYLIDLEKKCLNR